jgi:hypothetical protein
MFVRTECRFTGTPGAPEPRRDRKRSNGNQRKQSRSDSSNRDAPACVQHKINPTVRNGIGYKNAHCKHQPAAAGLGKEKRTEGIQQSQSRKIDNRPRGQVAVEFHPVKQQLNNVQQRAVTKKNNSGEHNPAVGSGSIGPLPPPLPPSQLRRPHGSNRSSITTFCYPLCPSTKPFS